MYEKNVIGIGDELCPALEVVKDKFFVRHDKSIFQAVEQRTQIRMPRDMVDDT